MTTFGYQASHEQFAPSELLRLSKLAQEAGFKAIHASDHFIPGAKGRAKAAMFIPGWEQPYKQLLSHAVLLLRRASGSTRQL